ncbi:MAG: trimeric autotransporter adhesin, partial [Candidatus Parcubacteria bacterium]
DALMAQLAALTNTTSSSSSMSCNFNTDMTIGAKSATDVQNFLIKKGYSIPAGATGYFGSQTAAAVAAFQTANAVSPAAGYWGPKTRAVANGMCSSTTDDSDNTTDDSDNTTSDLSGEASLSALDVEDGDDTEIEEGEEAAPVADVKVEFADGDAQITRLDIALDKNGAVSGQDNDPWDVIDEVTLWVDGDEVASIDASDEDNYLDDTYGTLRFSGLDIVAMEDDEVTITVGVSVQGSVDGVTSSVDAEWEVAATGLRFVDADDVTTTETTAFDLQDAAASYTADSVEFSIGEQGGDDELLVKSSSDDVDATTLELKDDKKTSMTKVFAFELDTDDSTNDITVNDIKVSVAATEDGTTGTSTALLINDAQLVIDGETYDDVTIVNGTTGTYSFDLGGDLVIEAGESVTVEFEVEFKALASTLEGATIQASTDATSGYDAEGADDLSGSQFQGSVTGEEHTLRTQGAVIVLTDDTSVLKANTEATTADDEGDYTLEFTVEAFNGDLYIDDSAVRGTTMGTEGANFIVTSGGTAVATGTAVVVDFTSDATLTGSRYKVSSGSKETFTLKVEFDPAAAGSYKVQLHSVNFSVDTNANPTVQQLALPAEDFDSAAVSI